MMRTAVILKIDAKVEKRKGREASGALLANKMSLVVGAGGRGVIDRATEGVILGVPDDVS